MSTQDEMSAAKQRLQNALQTIPTNRAVQAKDKAFYEGILLQVRAVHAAKQAANEPAQEIFNLGVDISCLERVVSVKAEYIAFLDAHMAAFEKGLETGAKEVEGGGMHWNAGDLIKYVEEDEKVYLARVSGFAAKLRTAIDLLNPAWVQTLGPKKDDGEVAEEMAKLTVEGHKSGEEKALEQGEKKSGGRLKGKARKEAKKAKAGKK